MNKEDLELRYVVIKLEDIEDHLNEERREEFWSIFSEIVNKKETKRAIMLNDDLSVKLEHLESQASHIEEVSDRLKRNIKFVREERAK